MYKGNLEKPMSTNRLTIFDTTLRDGEQAPGFSLRIDEKLKMARQLATLGVDILEAGFPIASDADAEAVRMIATHVRGPVIAGLARCHAGDIDRAGWALAPAPRGNIASPVARILGPATSPDSTRSRSWRVFSNDDQMSNTLVNPYCVSIIWNCRVRSDAGIFAGSVHILSRK